MLGNLLSVAALVLFASFHQAAGHIPFLNRHTQLASRSRGDVQLFKRFSATRWTFYDVGLGACGKHNVPSDFIVALNAAQFGVGYPGPNCFKTITLSFNGKTAEATIMDACPGCPYGGLDLSRGLFKFFASESTGVLSGDWWFNGGSEGSKVSQKHPHKSKPKTTKSQPSPTPISVDGFVPTLQPIMSKKIPSTTSLTPSSEATQQNVVKPTPSLSLAHPVPTVDFNGLYQAFLGAGHLILGAGALKH